MKTLQSIYNECCKESDAFRLLFEYKNNIISNIIDTSNGANVQVTLKQDKKECILTVKARIYNIDFMDYQNVKHTRTFNIECGSKTLAKQFVDLVKQITYCCSFTNERMRDGVLDRFVYYLKQQ